MKLKQSRSVLAIIAISGFLVTTSATADPSQMASWGNSGGSTDMMKGHGHGGNKSESWSASGAGGMMSEGHMTARLRKVWNLDLTADQRSKIRKIQHELRATTWEHEDAIEVISDKLFDMYGGERDAKAIGKVYAEIFDHRRQIIEAQIEAGNKVEALLSKEQRAQLKTWGPKPKWGSGWGAMQ